TSPFATTSPRTLGLDQRRNDGRRRRLPHRGQSRPTIPGHDIAGWFGPFRGLPPDDRSATTAARHPAAARAIRSTAPATAIEGRQPVVGRGRNSRSMRAEPLALNAPTTRSPLSRDLRYCDYLATRVTSWPGTASGRTESWNGSRPSP